MSFKTQAEIYQALWDGKTIIHVGSGQKVKMIDGELNIVTCDKREPDSWGFSIPSDWKIEPSEPMVLWVNVYPRGGYCVYDDEQKAKYGLNKEEGGVTKKFIEVVE